MTTQTIYGYCPQCGAIGLSRERRPNGNDKCANGHTYPSGKALSQPNEPVALNIALSKLKELQRFSFLSPKEGGVKRYADNSGNWIEQYEAVKILDDLIYEFPPAPPNLEAKIAELQAREKVLVELAKLTYGYLWHINAGLDAPAILNVTSITPEKCSHIVRKLWLDVLTKEQRGEGINKALEALANVRGE